MGTVIFVSHDRWLVSRLASRASSSCVLDGIEDFVRERYEEYLAACGDDHLDVDAVLLKARREKRKARRGKALGAKSRRGGCHGSAARTGPAAESGRRSSGRREAALRHRGRAVGRSRCKTCRKAITKDTLRIGILIVGPYGPGYLWHHLTCARRSQPDRVAEAYETEAWNNAKQPRNKLPSLEKLAKLRDEAVERKRSRSRSRGPRSHPRPARSVNTAERRSTRTRCA